MTSRISTSEETPQNNIVIEEASPYMEGEIFEHWLHLISSPVDSICRFKIAGVVFLVLVNNEASDLWESGFQGWSISANLYLAKLHKAYVLILLVRNCADISFSSLILWKLFIYRSIYC